MRYLLALLTALVVPSAALADLRGHGGPIRALAISDDGTRLLSGSFDTTAIVWDSEAGLAEEVLRFHDASVNAVTLLPDGRMVTAGQDGRIALWSADGEASELGRHEGPIVGLALSPDAAAVATASWDGTARITPLDGSQSRVLEGHEGNVNAVAFLSDGRVVTAGYDTTLRIWPVEQGTAPITETIGVPLNAVAVTPDDAIVAAGADGRLRLWDGEGEMREIQTAASPVTALALSPDGAVIASAAVDGSVWLVERASGDVRLTLQGADTPVWSLAFDPGDGTLFAGGGDRVIRQWNPQTGERINADAAGEAVEAFGDSRGAQIFAACQACHTLTEDGGNRAGPTLHGIFGRRIATAPGYDYSDALEEMEIVWTPETVSELFELGPAHYTPGTKMPEQRITDPADRQALVEFLEERTE